MAIETTFACGVSQAPTSVAAAEEACERALQQLGATPNLAFLFFTAEHVEAAEEIARLVVERIGTNELLGCSAESIVGQDREIESEPGIALWVAKLPDTRRQLMQLEFVRGADGASITGWPDDLPATWSADSAMFLLGDPFSFPADLFLERLNEDQPGRPVVGGMASAGHEPGCNRLICGSEVLNSGAVGLWVGEGIRIQSVVSQGCRPIGEPFVVTAAERNVIHQLGGKPAYEQLQTLYQTLPTTEQRMMQHGLHVGRVVNEYQDRFTQGDFLIRNVVGVDNEERSIAVGDFVRPGQTVQFHIRDAESADAELRQLLAAAKSGCQPSAALLFTCNGRGTRLFPEPHHDVSAIRSTFGDIPVAGLFAAGELGPIGGKNFLHGFTASIALFD